MEFLIEEPNKLYFPKTLLLEIDFFATFFVFYLVVSIFCSKLDIDLGCDENINVRIIIQNTRIMIHKIICSLLFCEFLFEFFSSFFVDLIFFISLFSIVLHIFLQIFGILLKFLAGSNNLIDGLLFISFQESS